MERCLDFGARVRNKALFIAKYESPTFQGNHSVAACVAQLVFAALGPAALIDCEIEREHPIRQD